MLYKFRKIFVLLLLLFSFSLVLADDCQFDSQDSICPRYSSSFINFSLDFTPTEMLQNYSASIYLTQNQNNLIQTRIDGNVVKNIEPLTEPGVYVLQITSISKSGVKKIDKHEFIFDNFQPLPPLVPMKLTSKLIVGKTQFKNTKVFAQVVGGQIVSTTSDSNSDFSLNLDGLDENNVNIVNFYVENSQGLESEKISRTIIIKDLDPSLASTIASGNITIDSNLDIINDKTIKVGDIYTTSNRNFLVKGTADANDGTPIYVNGVKTYIVNNKLGHLGRFAQFVLLNSGDNIIKVQDEKDTVSKTVVVKYVNPKFMFETFNVDKITSNNNPIVSGSTNLNSEFNVYLNGIFFKKIVPVNNQFEFNLNNLNPGKNFLYLSGPNNQILKEIIYLDVANPKIKVLSPLKLTSLSNFVFKVTDDLGVNLDSLKVQVGDKIFSKKQIEVIGDYVGVKFNDLVDGVYNYKITIKDRVGKTTTKQGQVDISKDNVLVEQIGVEDGYFLGNTIFLKSGKSKIVFKPSKFIAFKHIYLDGEDQINYEIKPNKFVELYLNPKKSRGTLELIYIDKNHHLFTQNLTYFSDLEKPRVKLDYISDAITSNNKIVRISGKILDENFDFSTLNINGKNSYQRVGNYFESYINFTGSNYINLDITGNDFGENNIENPTFGSLIYVDTTSSNVDFLKANKYGLEGKVNNYDIDNNLNEVNSYSTINSKNMFLADQFILPVSQKEGLQSINLKGNEKSGSIINSNTIFSVDSLKPTVQLIKVNSVYQLLIDGTLSQIKNVSIKKNNLNTDLSLCSYRISKYSSCYNFDLLLTDTLNVFVEDGAGNVYNKTLSLNDAKDLTSNNDVAQIFFNGNDLKTYKTSSFIQGNIISNSLINSVKIDGNDCQFDDISFVCLVNNLNNGINNFTLSVSNQGGVKSQSILVDKLVKSSNQMNLINLTALALYKIDGDYYISSDDLNAKINLLNSSQINVLIDNKKYLVGKKQGNTNININLTNQIAQKNNDEFEVKIETQDENQNSVSTSFKVFYSRIIQTLVKVFIE